MPGHNPDILIAQCWQESRFNQYAISPVGAKGLCQFMPNTWRDMQKALKIKTDAFHAADNITAAAYYDSKLYAYWTAKRPYTDHINLTLASYNAGAGNLTKAQARCNNANLYPLIIECLALITGNHAKETTDYVTRINIYREQLQAANYVYYVPKPKKILSYGRGRRIGPNNFGPLCSNEIFSEKAKYFSGHRREFIE